MHGLIGLDTVVVGCPIFGPTFLNYISGWVADPEHNCVSYGWVVYNSVIMVPFSTSYS